MPKLPNISDVKSAFSKGGEPREILIESIKMGSAMRVMAIDVNTSIEVSFQAPANASRATIERIAKDKLDYVIKKGKT